MQKRYALDSDKRSLVVFFLSLQSTWAFMPQ